jgi:hypothetical protein
VAWQTGPTWTVTEPVVLFDSVHESTEIAAEEHLRTDLPTGNYLIEAGYIEIPSEYLILVRLRAIDSPTQRPSTATDSSASRAG